MKAFRDGKVVGEFTGAIPPPRIDEFLTGSSPPPPTSSPQSGDEESLRKALEEDPAHREAAA